MKKFNYSLSLQRTVVVLFLFMVVQESFYAQTVLNVRGYVGPAALEQFDLNLMSEGANVSIHLQSAFRTLDGSTVSNLYIPSLAGNYGYAFRDLNPPLQPGEGFAMVISGDKNDDLAEGISTFDIVLLRRHLLGVKEIDGWRKCGADMNNSASLSTIDIILMRQLILAKIDDLEQVGGPESWRFMNEWVADEPGFRSDFEDDPFEALTTQQVGYPAYFSGQATSTGPYDPFLCETSLDGVKTGDMNNSNPSIDLNPGTPYWDACPFSGPQPLIDTLVEGKTPGFSVVSFNDSSSGQSIINNQVFTYNLIVDENVDDLAALQFGLAYDDSKVELLAITATGSLPSFTSQNYSNDEGELGNIRLSFDNPNGVNFDLSIGDTIVSLQFKALQAISDLRTVIFLDNSILEDLIFLETFNTPVTDPIDVKFEASVVSNLINSVNNNIWVTGEGYIILQSDNSKNTVIRLHSIKGDLLSEFPHTLFKGYNKIPIEEFNMLPNGTYVIELRGTGFDESIKFVK